MTAAHSVMFVTAAYAFANILMIGIEYIGRYFGKNVETDKVKKHHLTTTIALIATVLIGASIYVIPASLSILLLICRYLGYGIFAASFVMNHFWVKF